jgi:CBS domain-containing protein
MVSKIADVMTTNVVTVKKGTFVSEIVSLMKKHGISCIIVTDHSLRPLGIITERDMVRRVLSNSLNPRKTIVDDVMSTPVITMSSQRKITDAINMMQKFHFRRVVIATDKKKLLGILTQSDLLMEVHKVQLELEKMNEHLKNTVKSLQRYSKVGTTNARVKSLKDKITKMEKTLEKTQRIVENAHNKHLKKR